MEGELLFTATLTTKLQTFLSATTTLTVGTAVAGKPIALRHGNAELSLGADTVPAGTRVLLLQAQEVPVAQPEVAKSALSSFLASGEGSIPTRDELQLLSRIRVYPVGLVPTRHGQLTVRVPAGGPLSSDGLYQMVDGKWRHVGALNEPVPIVKLGQYAVLRDLVPPTIKVLTDSNDASKEIRAQLEDGGSGIDSSTIRLVVDGVPEIGTYKDGQLWWPLPVDLAVGSHIVEVRAADRAGNQTDLRWSFSLLTPVLPDHFELGSNYPNPFNPTTIIPFAVPTGTEIRLDVFNISGQLVRRLLAAGTRVEPGFHEVGWDGRDSSGRQVSSGIYLYRLESTGVVRVRRMMLLK